MKRIEVLQQQLVFWKKKMAANDKESDLKIKTLQKNKTTLMNQYRTLKNKMSKFRKTQNDRLSNVVTAARETNAKNSEILAMGERILKYAEIATKLQTEKEQVLPFGNHKDIEIKNEMHPINAEDDETNQALDRMKHFIQKYNIALMDTTCFEQKRKTLATENRKLRSILKAYLEGITVSSNTISEPNALLVINNNTQFIPKANSSTAISKVRTIVEGNQVVNSYQKQL